MSNEDNFNVCLLCILSLHQGRMDLSLCEAKQCYLQRKRKFVNKVRDSN